MNEYEKRRFIMKDCGGGNEGLFYSEFIHLLRGYTRGEPVFALFFFSDLLLLCRSVVLVECRVGLGILMDAVIDVVV